MAHPASVLHGLLAARCDGFHWTMFDGMPITTQLDMVINSSDIDVAVDPDGTIYAIWIDGSPDGYAVRVGKYVP